MLKRSFSFLAAVALVAMASSCANQKAPAEAAAAGPVVCTPLVAGVDIPSPVQADAGRRA